jgi:hypothetical protein
MKHVKLFENFLQSRYELVGDNLDEVLDSVNCLKFHYGKNNVMVEDESGHDSGDKVSVYLTFSDNIQLRSEESNIVREMNYVLEEEMKKTKLYKID